MDELKLECDTMEENTDLAQEYLSGPSKHILSTRYGYNYLRKITLERTDSRLFEKLARKIEENAELFAQLEVLKRKKRKEDVKKWDIHLLVQILLHQSNQKCCPYDWDSNLISMHPDSPLANLGHVALKLTRDKVRIVASENTYAVSYLFTKLCHEVGLLAVGLSSTSSGDGGGGGYWEYTESLGRYGCVGVITEHADTGSAVDTLLSSTTQYPWKVRRILIQESIYDTVIKTLERKCSVKPTEGTVSAELKQSCSDTKFYEDKLLLFDYTGNYKFTEEDPIFVGTYRTSKELLSLMSRYEPLCLSLWSCDVAESDEIAFSVNTPIVWVNEFGSFWGPPDAAEAYYFSVYTGIHMYKMKGDIEKLLKLRDAWRKIDIRSRKAILMEVINNCADYKNSKEKALKLLSSQRWRDSEKFVEIQNNRICIGRRDRDELYVPSGDAIDNVEEVFGFLIGGGAVMLECDPFNDWLEALMIKGVPIMNVDSFGGNRGDIVEAGGVKYNWTAKPNTKVVYKSFGTIFAN